MGQERGRSASYGASHHSPQPSSRNTHHEATGLDPSVNPDTFTTSGYTTSQHHDVSYPLQSDAAQPYMNNYPIPQGDYSLQQSLEAGYDPNFVPQSYEGDFTQNAYVAEYSHLNTSINPAEISKISSPDNASPRLLSPENNPMSGPQSPASTNGQFHTPQHSRNTSLDPNSAYSDWQTMQFRAHQRTPSDVSDRSSAHGSPYLPQADYNEQHSPFIQAQDPNTFGMDQFSLVEQHPTSQPGSTYVSPRLMPQQEGLGVNESLNLQYGQAGSIYPEDQYLGQHRHESVTSDIGQADQFVPPTIQIEPAPVSRQPSFGPQGETGGGLAPGIQRGRVRAQSDVTFTRPMGSRSVSPAPAAESLSVRSPSPASISRSSSPGVADGRITKDRRASTSAINNNNREYILDLADPTRPNAGQSGTSTRMQKHPATYQCTLCPKRFTRAYNLRSHLRTHTDERPFVCTVCGKAFARQHDRKRHEGLHSGEKKFVCKGELAQSPGQTWGCGRRFARADALGRHFRSEAGRVCIKPLLDEEQAERRQKMMMEQAQHQHQHQQAAMLHPVPQPLMMENQFALPAALLAQYPALQNIDWSALQNQSLDDGELSDFGGGVTGGYDEGGIDAGALSDQGGYGPQGTW